MKIEFADAPDLNGGETFPEGEDILADIKLRARKHTAHETKTTQREAVNDSFGCSPQHGSAQRGRPVRTRPQSSTQWGTLTTRNPIMALKISYLGVSLAVLALGSALPARAQFMTSFPAIIIVPAPTQNYAVAKPTDRSTAPDKLKASVDTPALVQTSIYQGRTIVR